MRLRLRGSRDFDHHEARKPDFTKAPFTKPATGPPRFSKGFARHKSEFYTDEKKPKKYWIYPLHKNSRQLLSSPSPLPEIFQKGTCEGVAGARCALPCKHLRSLSDAFYNIPDHRSPMSRRYSKIGMFGLTAHGLLVGSPVWHLARVWPQNRRSNQQADPRTLECGKPQTLEAGRQLLARGPGPEKKSKWGQKPGLAKERPAGRDPI